MPDALATYPDAGRPIGMTLCSGIGAPEVAAPWVDWRLASEIEKFPRAVLKHRLGYKEPADHNQGEPLLWGDMREVTPDLLRRHGIPLPNIVVAGTPCFTAGHMVQTHDGYRRIEDIRPGDMVLTHMGRFKPVLRTGSKRAAVGRWIAVGAPDGIVCTADHPFYAAADLSRSTKRNGKAVRVTGVGAMQWRAASETPGMFWAAVRSVDAERVDIPQPHGLSRSETMRLLGWYLGDGWIRTWRCGKKAITLGLSRQKVAAFRKEFPSLDQADCDAGTSRKIAIGCTEFCLWIEANIGCGAAEKTIPGWLMADQDRAELLRGYISTDGNVAKSGIVTINSVSEALALGAAALAQTVGFSASVTKVVTPDKTEIDGREVSQRDYFQCRLYPEGISRKSRCAHGYTLRKVQSFSPVGEEMVFNIEVADDNSFILNGAIVHNCQAFSVAGARKGLEDPRGNLTLAFVEVCHAIVAARPDRKLAVLWENVPGVLSDKGNAFGCFLGGLVGSLDAIPAPAGGSWTREGMVEGPRARAAWAVLDAQWFGVAQRRERLFVVVDFGGAVDPAAVLLEPDSLRGDTPPRREAWKGPAASVAEGVALRGRDGGGTAELTGPISTALRASTGGGDKPHVMCAEIAPTLDASFHDKQGLDNQHINGGGACSLPPVAMCLNAHGARLDAESETLLPVTGGGFDVAHSLRGEGFDASEDGTGRGTPLVPMVSGSICRDSFSGGAGGRPEGAAAGHYLPVSVALRGRDDGAQIEVGDDCAFTLRASTGGGDKPHVFAPVAHAIQERAVSEHIEAGPQGKGWQEEVAYTLEARHHVQAAAQQWAVRRLMPIECARLQAFPDDWTQIPWRGKPAEQCPDGPQYKALGNSMATVVVKYIMDRMRISMAEMETAQ